VTPQGYSATVRLTLRLSDRAIRLGQVGPTWFRTREPTTIPPGPATLEIEIDGVVDRTAIVIDDAGGPAQVFHYDLGD
jgi:hypothetical protein